MKDIVRKIGVVAAAVLLTGTSCRENGVTADGKQGKNDRSFGHEGGVTLLIKDADLARIEKKPVGDEIVIDDKSVKSPWYRADSHMGSIFFSEPGEYQVQVISDRVMALPSDPSALNTDKHTLINSLILKPMVN